MGSVNPILSDRFLESQWKSQPLAVNEPWRLTAYRQTSKEIIANVKDNCHCRFLFGGHNSFAQVFGMNYTWYCDSTVNMICVKCLQANRLAGSAEIHYILSKQLLKSRPYRPSFRQNGQKWKWRIVFKECPPNNQQNKNKNKKIHI